MFEICASLQDRSILCSSLSSSDSPFSSTLAPPPAVACSPTRCRLLAPPAIACSNVRIHFCAHMIEEVEERLVMLGFGVCENPFLSNSFDLSALLSELLLMHSQRMLQLGAHHATIEKSSSISPDLICPSVWVKRINMQMKKFVDLPTFLNYLFFLILLMIICVCSSILLLSSPDLRRIPL